MNSIYRKMLSFLAVAAAGASMSVIAAGQSDNAVTVTVTHRERIAVPAGAELSVKLLDVSRQDAPAIAISEHKRLTAGKQVPFTVELQYEPSAINDAHTYAVRAEIRVKNQLMFTTTEHHGVITRGNPKTANITLRRAGGGREPASSAQNPPSLETSYWRLTELNGAAFTAKKPGREAFLRFNSDDKRISASAGCNTMIGKYELDGEKLKIQTGASTMMACEEAIMRQEADLGKALAAVTSYKISGDALSLYAGDKIVAQYKAAQPPR